MFNDTIQLYPTPINIINKMIDDIDFSIVNTCLEPSVGTCAIADVLSELLRRSQGSSRYDNNKKDYKTNIYACEISKNLQVLAKDKGYRIVADDFLRFNTYQHFDCIVANPPFNQGDKHLLHMIKLAEQNNGSKIRCLLNAETIKNPYSNYRKLLLQKIEQYKGKIEFIQDAFIDAENKTGIEVALVRLDIEGKSNSIILDQLEKENIKLELDEDIETYEVGEKQDYITAICSQYQNEIKATVRLINEFKKVSRIAMREFKDNSSPILELRIHGDRNYSYNVNILNDTIKEIRYKYWKELLNSDKLSNLMTSNIRTQWYEKLIELKEYDFTPFNVRQVEFDIKMSLTKGIEQTILDLFDKFTRYAMQDGSKNIHMFTGWKSNNAYRLGKKVILPYVNAFNDYTGKPEVSYKIMDTLRDIEKTFTYIDCGVLQLNHVKTEEELKFNFGYGETKNIELTYFKIDFFKKGTAHLKFDDKYKDVLDRFNYIACSLKNWLPNSFAKKAYKDMNKDEKAVVKAYCGSEKVYEDDVMSKQELYDFNISNMKLLA